MAFRPAAILSLSGGLDSTTLLAHTIQQYGIDNVFPVQFMYGSKHNPFEEVAVNSIMQHYFGTTRELLRINLFSVFENVRSDLLLTGGEIPEGHYNDETMRRTVVPGRNMMFVSACAAIAESIARSRHTVADVLLGVHSGDHHIYPDCRPEFIQSVSCAVSQSSDGFVRVSAPFADLDKAGIVKRGEALNVPFSLTRTCYKAQELPCGKCGSCRERLEAFQLNDLKDPVTYAV